MKRIVFAFAALAFAASLSAQRLSADEFFAKYSGREGYTTVEISGSLFGLLGCREDGIDDNPLRKITSIRVLVREKNEFPSAEGFIPEIRSILKRGRYEELVTIRDNDTDLRFMVRSDRGEPGALPRLAVWHFLRMNIGPGASIAADLQC